jgi:hypothetical protein
MAGGASDSWPFPRGVTDVKPKNIKECLRAIKLNSEAVLIHMNSNNVKANGNIKKLFDNIVQWCNVGMEILATRLWTRSTPSSIASSQGWKTCSKKFNETIKKLSNQLPPLVGQESMFYHGPRWLFCRLQRAVMPPLLTCVYSNGTASTPGASPRNLNKDCEIIIKMGSLHKRSYELFFLNNRAEPYRFSR